MNTNPNATRILCYGDSITYGRVPNSLERYSANQRRTGIMQDILGSEYEIIEEGLRGRYTNFSNDKNPGRNGYDYFFPCVLSHLPLDILVLFLGTNNLQSAYEESAKSIAQSLNAYFESLNNACESFQMSVPKVVLISPPYINSSILKANSIFNTRSGEKSHQFVSYYKELADKYGCMLLDAGEIIGEGFVDDVHLSLEQNQIFGKYIAQQIKLLG